VLVFYRAGHGAGKLGAGKLGIVKVRNDDEALLLRIAFD
jgi:hypothetical protein